MLGIKEQITGYLGELAVERFFLWQGINCRRVNFSKFDALVDEEGCVYRLQIKTSRKFNWRITGGRNRQKPYSFDDIDGVVLVHIDAEGKDEFIFLSKEDVAHFPANKNDQFYGQVGWNNLKAYLHCCKDNKNAS